MKIVGQESSRGSGSTLCIETKACRKIKQRRKCEHYTTLVHIPQFRTREFSLVFQD